MKVYTAGGMHGDWRSKIDGAPGIYTINPTNKPKFESEDQYTAWDIEGVKQCDVVFAYLEESNPSGVGMAVEIAYGKAIGKTVIFVDEKHDRYFGMCRSLADVVFDNLKDGLDYLDTLGAI